MNRLVLWFALVVSGAIMVYYIQKITRRKMGLTTWDSKTDAVIDKLHPKMQQLTRDFINKVEDELGITLRAYSGLRTYPEQTKLYAQGRTEPGKIVTWAMAGYSDHNFGLAIDTVEIKNGKALWVNPNWEKIALIGEKMGFNWGGRWSGKKRDRPHFYKRYGNSLAGLRALNAVKVGDYVYLA